MSIKIYTAPKDLWSWFEANKESAEFRFTTLAESDSASILATCEEGELVLCYDDPDDYYSESVIDKDDAETMYSTMLEYMQEPVPPEEPAPEKQETFDDLDEIRAAAYAFCGVLLGESPEDAGMDEDAIDEVASYAAWFLKGRFDLKPVID